MRLIDREPNKEEDGTSMQQVDIGNEKTFSTALVSRYTTLLCIRSIFQQAVLLSILFFVTGLAHKIMMIP